MNEPKNLNEWQDAADAAYLGLVIDSAWQYGLIVRTDKNGKTLTGSGVNVARCIAILERAKALNITARKPSL